ncbi:hypothetical protein HMPREF9440_02305 [Sutterella parvirubra YIT 11816]|uniref:Uncharacterized protein n=1 Tax=Sutterella parvirubra YIT 11816 TaxID=762967 RepID=H3KHQ9_9BURK|nr:hypothetical protein HMPREF9440_02305 [Sutterella parvirubra YIT 11816]
MVLTMTNTDTLRTHAGEAGSTALSMTLRWWHRFETMRARG